MNGERHYPKGVVVRIAEGAAGLAKAALGVDRAPDDVIAARLKACEVCEHHNTVTCGACGCVLAAKRRLASERCPLDPPRWGPVTN